MGSQLERPLTGVEQGGQRQHPGIRVVAPLDGLVADRKISHPDAVPASQPLGDPGRGVADREAGLREDLLGSKVE